MELWRVNKRPTRHEANSLSQADVSAYRQTSQNLNRRKGAVALALASTILLATGAVYLSRKPLAPKAPITEEVSGKEKARLSLVESLKGSPVFQKLSGGHENKTVARASTKMSGAPLALPLFFEANRGQSGPTVQFLARSSGYTLFVTPTETVFAGARVRGTHGSAAESPESLSAILHMQLLNSNPTPEINGFRELPGKVNYLIGKDRSNWHTGIPLYEEVRSHEVYPGIDLVYHGDLQRLEYDFVVSPGADSRRIQFKVSGAEKVEVADNGDLLMRAAKSEFRMHKPVIYQQVGEQRVPVDGGFSLQSGKLVAFRVGAYDKKLPLVIDPSIVYATFLGAAGVEADGGAGLDATNPSSLRMLIAGTSTDITTFAESHTLIGTSPGASDYSFVAKIDPTTTGAASLNFLTFVGGSTIFSGGTGACQNLTLDMKLDVSGGAGQAQPVLVGNTNCSDFPVTFGGPTTGP